MYQVWNVFTTKEDVTTIQYFVINLETRQIQSVWGSLMQAREVCQDLNRRVA